MDELFEYTTIEEGDIIVCMITNYIGSSKEVVIPKTISIEGKNIPVKIINCDAFYNKGLTSVDLSNVDYIGEGAFVHNKLKSVDLSRVEEISCYAFCDNNLEIIILPEKFRDKTEWIFGFDNEELESRNKKYVNEMRELYMKKLYRNSRKYGLIFEYITYYTYRESSSMMLEEAVALARGVKPGWALP